MAHAHLAARGVALLLALLATAQPAQGQTLQAEARSAAAPPPPFLQRFPSFASSQAFSRGGSASFSKAFSSSGAHAFSNSFALGPDGERRLLHRAFSESNATGDAAGGARTYSAAGTTADGGAYSESGAHASSAAEVSSSAYSSSGAESSSSSQAGESHSFASSSGGGERFSEAASSSSEGSSSNSFSKENGLLSQGQRVSESSGHSSSSLGAAVQSAFLAAEGGGPPAPLPAQRVTHLTRVAEVPVLRPVVPVVQELVPARVHDQLDAVLLPTPVPIVEELNFLPFSLQPVGQVANQVLLPWEPPFPAATTEHRGALPWQRVHRHQNALQTTPATLSDQRQKPVAPTHRHPPTVTVDHQHVSSGSLESHKRGQTSHATSGQTNTHRETHSSHFSSSHHQNDEPAVRIGYQSGKQNNQRYGQSTVSREGQRFEADSIKNIMEAMQSFVKTSSHSESHRDSHREAHRTNSQDSASYDSVVTGKAPEIDYQSGEVKGVKETFQQASNSQSDTNINNIISQITRDAAELSKRPYFVVTNEQASSKFSESHSGNAGGDDPNTSPHLEDVDGVVHTEDFAASDSHAKRERPRNTVNKSEDPEIFWGSETNSEDNSEERRGGNGKYLTFNGRRYSSEDLAREFNRTRPTLPPPSPKPHPHPTSNSATRTQAGGSSSGPERPDGKQPAAGASAGSRAPPPKGDASKLVGTHYHQFVPPALFDSAAFSRFFFDRFRPGQPLPSASDFAEAVAKAPASLAASPRRPARPPAELPADYFVYPGTVRRESDLPDYVRADMAKSARSAASGSGSGLRAESTASVGVAVRRPPPGRY